MAQKYSHIRQDEIRLCYNVNYHHVSGVIGEVRWKKFYLGFISSTVRNEEQQNVV